MKRSELFFDLPEKLIAQVPIEPRDHCRLLIVDKKAKTTINRRFFDIIDYLQKGDVLVFNNSKVLPARLLGKKETGGVVEVLLLKDLGAGEWRCLVRNGKVGATIFFEEGLVATIQSREEEVFLLAFNQTDLTFLQTINKIGQMPTPPYVKTFLQDVSLYQTVYAKEIGSAAAPTAGLHFTEPLLQQLAQKGVQQEFVTLHVGLGTFQPVLTDTVEDHPIHSEYFTIEKDVLNRLKQAKQEGRRIIAVGTTSVRVLESVFSDYVKPSEDEDSLFAETNIFIYPGYQFQAIDGVITNFHTPYSSLLALVYAFAGQDFMKGVYHEAIQQEYRFFSFGDAMLIL